jgi:tRNA G18 (ribose-2'-O)-methylase SpoU
MRGYFAIGVYRTKCEINIGTLIRSAYSFGADFVFTVNKRYKAQTSAIKTHRHIPVLHFKNISEWRKAMPFNSDLIIVEIDESAIPIRNFTHPERAIYLLGAEDTGVPKEILNNGTKTIQLPGEICLNVSTAGSIVMFDRLQKNGS